MRLGLNNLGLTGGGNRFSPTSLFTAGENGAWYDASDFSTMYQDSAGTTPVTAVGQAVGKLLDKSGRGNHLTQPTTAARPVLKALYNQIVATEDLAAATWTKANSSAITAADATAPAGFTVSTTITYNGGGVGCYISQAPANFASAGKARLYVKPGTCNYIQLISNNDGTAYANFDLLNGVVGTRGATFSASSITAVGNGWYLITATSASPTSVDIRLQGVDNASVGYSPALTTGGTIKAIGFDYRSIGDVSINIPAYQRVTTTSDYDTAGFPMYLSFDGVDDAIGGTNWTAFTTSTMVLAGRDNGASDANYRTGFSIPSQVIYINQPTGIWGGYNGAAIVSSYSARQNRVLIQLSRAANDVDLYTDNNAKETKTTGLAYDARSLALGGSSTSGGTQFATQRVYGALAINRALNASELARIKTFFGQKAGLTL